MTKINNGLDFNGKGMDEGEFRAKKIIKQIVKIGWIITAICITAIICVIVCVIFAYSSGAGEMSSMMNSIMPKSGNGTNVILCLILYAIIAGTLCLGIAVLVARSGVANGVNANDNLKEKGQLTTIGITCTVVPAVIITVSIIYLAMSGKKSKSASSIFEKYGV